MRALSVVLFLLLAGCAGALRQGAETAPDAYRQGQIDGDGFVSFDGARLGLQSWLPPESVNGGKPKAVIAGLHGMGDYSETFYLAGPWWAEQGIATYAYDQRGFGRSPRRGVWPEQEVMMADVAYFVAALRAEYPDTPVILVGVSMGGAASLAAFGSATPPDVDGLVLVSPAVWGWSQMNPLYSIALRLATAVAPGWSPTGESLNRWPSDNIEMLRKLGRDPLMVRATRIDAVYGLVELMEAGWRTRAGRDVPALILMGQNDQIVPPGVIERYAERQSPEACFKTYPAGYHMLLRDLQAENVWRDIAGFIGGNCPAPATAALSAEDGTGAPARR